MAIAIVLERYPVASIRDIDGAFKSIRKRIGREMLTLDEIENRLRDTRDARIHFAIVCASKSCPPLAPKAYRAEGLSAALDAQGRAFVNDPTKNVLDRSASRLALSKIFEWNRKEFERDGGSLDEIRRRSSSRSLPWPAGWKRFRRLPNSSSTTGRSTSPEESPPGRKKRKPPVSPGGSKEEICVPALSYGGGPAFVEARRHP